jgi:hypothetical protein
VIIALNSLRKGTGNFWRPNREFFGANREFNQRIREPKSRVGQSDHPSQKSGGVPVSPADFGKFIADETEKWGKVIRAANIKPE